MLASILLFATFFCHTLATSIIVSCPGKLANSRAETLCSDTPIRIQFNLQVTDYCDPTTTSKSVVSDADMTQCYKQQQPCSDDRDCCSHWCDYEMGMCSLPSAVTEGEGGDQASPGSKAHGYNLRRRLKPPKNDYDDAVYDENSNYCASNSDCQSFRCENGMCDDDLGSDVLSTGHCGDTYLSILYTLGLSLDAGTDVGEPNFENNTDYTQFALPGEFIDVSFPGTITIKYKVETCTSTGCTYSSTFLHVVVIGDGTSSKNTNDKTLISEDNLPAAGGNYSYLRSAVVFDSFKGGAGQFNRSAFVSSIVDAINYDRKIYNEGESSDESSEEFSEVPPKAVSIIVVDPVEKFVQYEIRVRNEDANAVRGRLLHAYFKFPLVLRLSYYGILDPIHSTPFSSVHVDSSNSLSLKPEPLDNTVSVAQTLVEIIGIEGIVGIAVACLTFVLCSIFVLCRFCKQEVVAHDQKRKEKELSAKEMNLNDRERELAAKVEALLKNTKGIKSTRDNLKREAKEAECALEEMRQEQTLQFQALETQLQKQEEMELLKVEQRLVLEEASILQSIEEAKKNGDLDLAVTATVTTGGGGGGGEGGGGEDGGDNSSNVEEEAAMKKEIDALVINATMDNKEIQKQLNARREIMIRRTRERNQKRKKERLAAKEKEILRAEASDETRKIATMKVQSLWSQVSTLNVQVKANEQKVEALQQEAELNRLELERETKKKNKQAHQHLTDRLAKRKKKKEQNQKKKKQQQQASTVVVPAPAPPTGPPTAVVSATNDRSLFA